ncbi:MAG: WbuC family cupin fold metalloprotein [Sulfuritalea sp.]|nr:WbuC family cupin fold metalloprotein [Sulfuritalea sp.]
MDGATFKELGAAVEVATSPFVVVDEALIDRTIERARQAPQRRARVLLHPGQDDSLHEMVIALPQESCDVPHINFKSGKSFHVVRGEMAVMIFADNGSEVTPCRLGEGTSGQGRMVRLNRPCWHTVIPLSDYVVFIETILGPFTGNQFAQWAPAPDGTEPWSVFADSLREIATGDVTGRPAVSRQDSTSD